MNRSEINKAVLEAKAAFEMHHWALPPNPKWDVTDFGLGDFSSFGLVLVNLAEQPEYCEKLMYVRRNQVTPSHCHKSKKEDIICRFGVLSLTIYSEKASERLQVNGEWRDLPASTPVLLKAGERITLTRGIRHDFHADSKYAIVGEVSTANDDSSDNFFDNPDVGRFSEIVEDEKPIVRLVSE